MVIGRGPIHIVLCCVCTLASTWILIPFLGCLLIFQILLFYLSPPLNLVLFPLFHRLCPPHRPIVISDRSWNCPKDLGLAPETPEPVFESHQNLFVPDVARVRSASTRPQQRLTSDNNTTSSHTNKFSTFTISLALNRLPCSRSLLRDQIHFWGLLVPKPSTALQTPV